jgi:hypothetical protein
MSTRLLLLAALLSGCLFREDTIKRDEQSYRSDTELLKKVFAPLRLEESHGQLTVVVGAKFTEKLIRASLQPNALSLAITTPGRAWSETVAHPIRFDNEVWLDSGRLDMDFTVSDLNLRGDLIEIHGKMDGHGQLNATARLYGVKAQRNVEVWMHYEDVLQLHLEHNSDAWLLRLVGPPLKLHVDLQLPALKIGGHEMLNLKFAREVEYAVENISAWQLPLPAPRTVQVGTTTLSLGLTNLAIGTRDGLLWIGSDLVVGEPAAPAPEPKSPPSPPPATTVTATHG